MTDQDFMDALPDELKALFSENDFSSDWASPHSGNNIDESLQKQRLSHFCRNFDKFI